MTIDEVQTLVSEIPCDLCNAPPGMAWYMVAAAIIDLSNGDPVPATTQELVTEANCLMCAVPPGMLPYLMITALRNIAGGGGGIGGVTCGSGDPVAAPSGSCGLYVDTDAPPSLWAWDGAAWQQLIA